jgi:hypothetical protein
VARPGVPDHAEDPHGSALGGTHFTELKVRRDPECPICGPNAPEIPESEMGKFPDYELFCAG